MIPISVLWRWWRSRKKIRVKKAKISKENNDSYEVIIKEERKET